MHPEGAAAGTEAIQAAAIKPFIYSSARWGGTDSNVTIARETVLHID